LSQPTRLAAVEALAALGRVEAEARLVQLAQGLKDTDLRKAAWRGVRRSKRARAKAASGVTSEQ
jgi:ParB family chromosome partitioning protein